MSTAEQALRRLQGALATPAQPEEGFIWRKGIPRALAGDKVSVVTLSRAQVEALGAAEVAVSLDLRFEHLDKTRVTDAVWHFAASCLTGQPGDQVAHFVERDGKEVMEKTCYMPVLHLSVEQEQVVAGLTLLPPSDDRIPKHEAIPPASGVCAIAAVPARGTSYPRMAERARLRAEHSLRLVRIALRAHRSIHDRQLRFTLGTTYVFADHGGWKAAPGDAWPLGPLNEELCELIASEPIGALPFENQTDIERAASRAAAWLERAQFAGDPLIEMLYSFFALETLVGDKASGAKGTKGHVVAFRQALLSSIVRGGFTDPDETLIYYDEVRSNAVHGSEPLSVDEQIAGSVTWAVRLTLSDYLTMANDLSLSRRSKLLAYLGEHEDEPKLREWLRSNGVDQWKEFLDLDPD